MVSKADRVEAYANWLTSNTDKRGTDEFKTVADAYRKLRQKDRQPGSAQRLVYGINRGLFDALGVSALEAGLDRLGFDTSDFMERFRGSPDTDLGRAGRAGRTVGTSLGFGAALGLPFARAGASALALPAGQISVPQRIAASTVAPLTTRAGVAAETGASVGAGIGTAGAEASGLDTTGQSLAEFGGAVLGGTGGLLGATGRGAQAAAQSLGNLKRSVTSRLQPDAGQRMASEEARRVIFEEGGDPDAVAAALRNQPDDVITPSLIAQDPSVMGMTQALAGSDRKFGQQLARQKAGELQNLSRQVQQVRASGDPRDFAVAAEQRAQGFEDILTRWVSQAEQRALGAADDLRIDGRGRANLSEQARETVERAIGQARDQEEQLYAAANLDQKIDASPIMATIKGIEKDELYKPSKALRGVLRAGAARFAKKDKEKQIKPVEARKVQAFRSEVLSLAREARSKNNFAEARRLNQIADAALDTMDGVRGIDDALSYSRALNDVYRRSVIGRITGRDGDGRFIIEPSRTLEATVRGTPEQRALAAEDLIRGAGGVRGETPEQATEMQGLVENFAMQFANVAVDATTGRVNSKALRKFLRENDRLFESLPGLRERVSTAAGAEEFLKRIETSQPGLRDRMRKRVFGRLAAKSKDGPIEDPSELVRSALEGPAASRDYFELVRTANKGGPKAKEGLRVSILDYAFGNTGRVTANNVGDQPFDPAAALDRLRKPLSPRDEGSALIDQMVKNKLFTKQQRDALIQQLERLNRFVQRSAASEELGVELITKDPFLEVMARLVGSNLATVGSFTPSSSLIMGAEGSKRAREFILDMPAGQMKTALTEALLDKDAFADLLTLTSTKPRSGQGRRAFENKKRDAQNRLGGFFANIFGLDKMPTLAATQQAIDAPMDFSE